MENILKNKKLILIFLTVILLLILLSSYIKTTEIELTSFFDQKDKLSEKELLFEADKKTKDAKIKKKEALTENENNQRTNLKKGTEIENIALIKEIKDPFQAEAEQNKTAENSEEKPSQSEEIKINTKRDLILLEKNIIAEEIVEQAQNSKKISQSEKEISEKLTLVETKNNSNSPINGQSLKSIRLPFKLMGIIKNRNNSSALFLYQGQTFLKKEKEKIDIFKIEKINNKNLILSYQNEERRLHLWEEKNNEN